MYTAFTLKNFRLFKNPVTIQIKPLTILTGPNNSGKSSVIKALLLFKNAMQGADIGHHNLKLPSLLKPMPEIQMGNIKEAINDQSESSRFVYAFHYLFGKAGIPIDIEFTINTEYSLLKFPPENAPDPVIESLKIMYDGAAILAARPGYPYLPLFGRSAKLNLPKWIELINQILDAEAPATGEKEPDQNTPPSNHTYLRPFVIDYLRVNKLNPAEILYNKFIFEHLINKSNFPLSHEKLTQLAHEQGLELTGDNANNTSKKNTFADQLIELIEWELNQGQEYDQFLNKLSDTDFVTSILSFMEQRNHEFALDSLFIDSDLPKSYISGVIREAFEDRVFDQNFLSPEEIGFKTEAACRMLYSLTGLFKDLEFPNFAELIKQIALIYKSLLAEFLRDINALDYVPHNKLPLQRHIPITKDHWLTTNLLRFKNHTSRQIDDRAKEMARNLARLGKNEKVLFNEWLKYFDLQNYKVLIEEDDHSEYLQIFLYDQSNKIKRHINDFAAATAHLIISMIVLANKDENTCLIFEEPETHLHPKFQALLADTFVDFLTAPKEARQSLLLETHSTFLIQKLQHLVANRKFNPKDLIIHYFDDPNPQNREKNSPQVQKITCYKNGNLSRNLNTSFFEEFQTTNRQHLKKP